MGPTTYALCQKLGLAMFMIPLCDFPPLFVDEPVNLRVAGSSLVKQFTVPVDKEYPLVVTFDFLFNEARLSDQVVGERGCGSYLEEVPYDDLPEVKRVGLGRPIPLHVVIRRAADQSVVLDRIFNSRCITATSSTRKVRAITLLELAVGDYTVEVTNLKAQAGLDDVKTGVSIYVDLGKWINRLTPRGRADLPAASGSTRRSGLTADTRRLPPCSMCFS